MPLAVWYKPDGQHLHKAKTKWQKCWDALSKGWFNFQIEEELARILKYERKIENTRQVEDMLSRWRSQLGKIKAFLSQRFSLSEEEVTGKVHVIHFNTLIMHMYEVLIPLQSQGLKKKGIKTADIIIQYIKPKLPWVWRWVGDPFSTVWQVKFTLEVVTCMMRWF